jgi:hypothetical protein
MMTKTVPDETGCYIDGSHISNLEFMISVIEFAHDNYGLELEWDQFVADRNWLSSDEVDDERHFEIMDALDWTYEDAIEYLNDNTREGLYWEVIDQSLYLTEDADASQ